jgi:hypothetical protein
MKGDAEGSLKDRCKAASVWVLRDQGRIGRARQGLALDPVTVAALRKHRAR